MTVVNLNDRGSGRETANFRPGPMAALDIGSSKICCMVGESLSARKATNDLRTRLRIDGFGYTASRGIHAGAVSNVLEAERAIRLAVDAAEKMAGRTIEQVYVSATGGRPVSFCQSGCVQTATGAVSPRDIDMAVTLALKQTKIGSRSILHLAPVGYKLDGTRSVDPPLGLHGKELVVELGVVTVERAFLHNMTEAVERAHLQVAGFVMSPYAAAHAVLVNDEMKLGTVLVEFGSALTSVGFFNGGHLVAADTISLGGEHVTNDIALGLNTNLAHAERLKTLHGNVLTASHDEQELLAVPILGETSSTVQHVHKGTLTAIIRPRVEEILEHVRDLLASGQLAGTRNARLVFAGGGSSLPGLRELAAGILGRHVRIAEVPALDGLSDAARQSRFSVATGLMCYALSPDPHYDLPLEAAANIERQHMGYMRRVGRWLADSL